jgi:hypothetical protein
METGGRITMAACHDPGLRLGVSGGRDFVGGAFATRGLAVTGESEFSRLVGREVTVIGLIHEDDRLGVA